MPALGASITTVNSFGSQGTNSSYTVTITAGAAGIKTGDVGILLVYSSDHNFATPSVASITDSLSSSWSVGSSVGVNLAKDIIFTNFGANEQTVSLCTAPMGGNVAGGATFTITVTMQPGGGFIPTTLEVDFVSITGVAFTSGNEAAWLAGQPDNILGASATFKSNATIPTKNLFYVAFALPFSTLVSIPAGYSTISGFTNSIVGASYTNISGASANDTWTQTSVTDWGCFQVGYTPTSSGPGGPETASGAGKLSIWNADNQRLWVEKGCKGASAESEFQANSSSLVTIGTSPVTLSISNFTINSGSIKNVGSQNLNVTLNELSGSTTKFTLTPQSIFYFVGLEEFLSIVVQTASGTTSVEYLIAG